MLDSPGHYDKAKACSSRKLTLTRTERSQTHTSFLKKFSNPTRQSPKQDKCLDDPKWKLLSTYQTNLSGKNLAKQYKKTENDI